MPSIDRADVVLELSQIQEWLADLETLRIRTDSAIHSTTPIADLAEMLELIVVLKECWEEIAKTAALASPNNIYQGSVN